MKAARGMVACVGLLVYAAKLQAGPQEAPQPSPMEAFAQQSDDVRSQWAYEVGRFDNGQAGATDGASAVITALVLQSGSEPARKMRGVRINLARDGASDVIYLDEEATQRTKSALEEIAAGVANRGLPSNGCFGAAAFWPLYDWPWNKYHELNAEVCNTTGRLGLVLSGRNKAGSYFFPGKTPESLATILGTALEQLERR